MSKVFLSLGSNLGDKFINLQSALFYIEKFDIKILKKSSIYETEPVEMLSKKNFFNMVILVQTYFLPLELLDVITQIEIKLGRLEKLDKNYFLNKKLNVDRTIDIDILDYENFYCHYKNLILPHPKISNRLFVLIPLSEISPFWVHPINKKSINILINDIKNQNSKIKKILNKF